MSIASELRRRLDELIELKKNPAASQNMLFWDERALSFMALDALPYFLAIVEDLDGEGGTSNPVVGIHAMTRIWENVHALTKEASDVAVS